MTAVVERKVRIEIEWSSRHGSVKESDWEP